MNKKIKELLNIKDKNKDVFKIEDLANYIKSSYKNEFVKNIITAHFMKNLKYGLQRQFKIKTKSYRK